MYPQYPPSVDKLCALYNKIFIFQQDLSKPLDGETYRKHQQKTDKLAHDAARVAAAFNRVQDCDNMDEETAQFWIDFYTGKLAWEPIVEEYEAKQKAMKQEVEDQKSELWRRAKAILATQE